MSAVMLITLRELKAIVRSWIGYAAAAGVLLIDGVWFMANALGGSAESKLSAAVLAEFFMGASGTTAVLAVALSMRLIAAEHDAGTLVLLKTAPIKDWEVVLGKFLSAVIVLLVVTALTAYMPLMLLKAGKISWGHVGVGYLGVLLLGIAVTAIGLFASSWAKNQVVAAIAAGVVVGLMYLWWKVAQIADPPVKGFIEGLAIHHLRFRDFMTGTLRLENVCYYLGVSFFFLLASVKTLEARRWR